MIQTLRQLGYRRLLLSSIAFVCASISILALLLHATGWLPMYFMIDLLGPPSIVLLLALGVYAHRINESIFLNRLAVGVWAGLVSTFAYDGIRYVFWQTNIFSFNPFISHPIFGTLISGLPETTTAAILIGWAYHFWNGIGFGIMYTLVAGPAHWRYAILWALFLEVGWLTALPSVLEFRLNTELVALSLIGHGAYGIGLGLLSQRFIRE